MQCTLASDIATADRHRPLQLLMTEGADAWTSNAVDLSITDDLRVDAVSGCGASTPSSSGAIGCMPGRTLTLIGAGFTRPATLSLYASADPSALHNASYLVNISAKVVSGTTLLAVLSQGLPWSRWLSAQLTCGVLSPPLPGAVGIADDPSLLSSTGGGSTRRPGSDDVTCPQTRWRPPSSALCWCWAGDARCVAPL